MAKANIELFLSPADEGGQTLNDGLNPDALDCTGAKHSKGPKNFVDAGANPNSLRAQRWGVVAPKGDDGDRLLELVQPLIQWRAEEQGREVTIYRKPARAEDDKWKRLVFEGNKRDKERPLYVLMLGGFDGLSIELQKSLSTMAHVGRLSFDRDGDYQAYVKKLIDAEKSPRAQEFGNAVLFTARDGTAANELAYENLMEPNYKELQELKDDGDVDIDQLISLVGDGAQAGTNLLEQVGSDHPSVLFSCSHGMGPPRAGWKSPDHQRALQGALCLGQGEKIDGASVKDTPFLPNGLWLYFACFGAGTPSESEFYHWLARLKGAGEFGGDLDAVLSALPAEGELPFVASLPKTVLANPRGPLGVIGHLDLAWSYGFQDMLALRKPERYRRFQDVLEIMLGGHRIGIALGKLYSARESAKLEVMKSIDEAAKSGANTMPDDSKFGHSWMTHQDLDGYVLLGDPAAYLPVDAAYAAEEQARDRAKPPVVPEVQAEDAPAPDSPPPLALSVAEQVALGELTGQSVAAEHNVSPDRAAELKRVYQNAGQAALARLSGVQRDE